MDVDLTYRSLYDVLGRDCGLVIARGRRWIEAVAATARHASLLGVRKGSPLIRLESVSYLADGRAVEAYDAIHRSDRAQFEVDLVRLDPWGSVSTEGRPNLGARRGAAQARAADGSTDGNSPGSPPRSVPAAPGEPFEYHGEEGSVTERMVDVCVVGAGRAGMVHARNFRWNIPDARLVGIVETNADRTTEALAELDMPSQAAAATLEEAFTKLKPQAVVVTTPTFTHADLVVAAASAGKHILCEKPLTLSLRECDRIDAAIQAAGVVFEMGFMRRFDPPFIEAERLLRSGKIGSPVMMRSLTRGPGLPPAWADESGEEQRHAGRGQQP